MLVVVGWGGWQTEASIEHYGPMVTQFHAVDRTEGDIALPSPLIGSVAVPCSRQVLGKSICQPGRMRCGPVDASRLYARVRSFVRSFGRGNCSATASPAVRDIYHHHPLWDVPLPHIFP